MIFVWTITWYLTVSDRGRPQSKRGHQLLHLVCEAVVVICHFSIPVLSLDKFFSPTFSPSICLSIIQVTQPSSFFFFHFGWWSISVFPTCLSKVMFCILLEHTMAGMLTGWQSGKRFNCRKNSQQWLLLLHRIYCWVYSILNWGLFFWNKSVIVSTFLNIFIQLVTSERE